MGIEGTPTREVFGNIVPWMRVVFYVMIYASLASLAWQVWGRVRLWRRGQPGGFERDWRLWLRRVAVYAVAQKRVHRKSLGAVLHVLLASGFVVLAIGTTLLAIADQGPVNFHRGYYYLIYELTMDIFGVAFCVGCVLAMWRRAFRRPASLGHAGLRDWVLLGLLLALGITGFVVEALRLHYTEVPAIIARWSIVGHAMQTALLGGLDTATTRDLHLGFWWLHAILVAAFFVAIPVTRFLHVLTGPLNIAARPERAMGALAPARLEEVEQTGRMGVAGLADFTRQQLLSLDACMECGRCHAACPAWATGKPLSPMHLVVDLRNAMSRGGEPATALVGQSVTTETIWACTMCQACVEECPVLIGQVDLVSDLRRNLVGEGRFSGPAAQALRHLASRSNPYGRANGERMQWAEGLTVPTVEVNPGYDYLFWVGCAGAFDPRAQRVTRAMVRLLERAGVDFAVLGRHERCTGDTARRLGDEFLFQELARANIQTLDQHKATKIVTACPHCFNTLHQEYSQFGGHYQVQHHSQLLAELLAAGRLRGLPVAQTTVTLHDPCYLARANGVVDEPRQVLRQAASDLREMGRHGRKTFCCGAGGGRMWSEEAPTQRVSRLRADEAAETGAARLATGCPFCLNMMTDAAGARETGKPMEVLDLAELLWEAQERTLEAADAAAADRSRPPG